MAAGSGRPRVVPVLAHLAQRRLAGARRSTNRRSFRYAATKVDGIRE
jgi:hypothetical protein